MIKNEIEKMQKIRPFWSNGWQDYYEDQSTIVLSA